MHCELKDDIIVFESNPDYYFKEASGQKNNTVRLDPSIRQIKTITKWYNSNTNRTIRIINTVTRESFDRILTDMSIYKNVIIFTWRHE